MHRDSAHAAAEAPALEWDYPPIGDYAIIGLAAVQSKGNRFVYFGAGASPVFAKHASMEKDLKAAKTALARDLDPPADLYNSSATKLHLAGVLLERAWNQLTTSH